MNELVVKSELLDRSTLLVNGAEPEHAGRLSRTGNRRACRVVNY